MSCTAKWESPRKLWDRTLTKRYVLLHLFLYVLDIWVVPPSICVFSLLKDQEYGGQYRVH